MTNQADKLKLFELTFNKVANDPAFFAWHLQQFSQIENKIPAHLQEYLQCTPENFYKLGLSKVPASDSADYHARLVKIAEYSTISVHKINHILFQVQQLEKIIESVERKTLEDLVFNGWRESENKVVRAGISGFTTFENSLHAAINYIPSKIYKTGLALVAIFLTIFISSSKVDEKNFYASIQKNHKENSRHLALQDNTQVIKARFKKV